MITEQAFKKSAGFLGVEIAAIKAVAEVESGGDGFLPDGKVKILFEPHIFWKELKKVGINPEPIQSDILYPVWGSKPYGKVSAQHERLDRAIKISQPAALKSASYGKFQIMGFNHKAAGFDNIDGFVAAMSTSEDEQLSAFTTYIRNTGLDDELKFKDWAGFARAYNGAAYAKNNYDKKLAAAYNKFKASL